MSRCKQRGLRSQPVSGLLKKFSWKAVSSQKVLLCGQVRARNEIYQGSERNRKGEHVFQAAGQVMNVHWSHSTLGANSASRGISHPPRGVPSSRASGRVSLSTNSSAFKVMSLGRPSTEG